MHDIELIRVLYAEVGRQQNTINLIASENYASLAVLQACSSVLSNKYSEGYPGKRYYAGNKYADEAENLAITRAKKLFKVDHANVQPHAGSPANMAAYFALLKKGDKILSMDLAHGGHLTHGSKVNFSGKLWRIVHYGVSKETGKINMNSVRRIALKERPKLIVAGATAYPRAIDFKSFGNIAKEVGAYLLTDIAHIAGLIVGGQHQSPAPYADVITTTTHKTLRGPRGAMIMCKREHAKAIDKAVFPGIQGGPLDNIIAAKAVALFEASQPEFKEYSEQIVKNAKALADNLIKNGFSLVSGGTDNHLILVDLSNKGLTGKEASIALEKAGIIVNMNMVPYDTRTPFNPSGIRLGTPALTTRGFKEEDMSLVGDLISLAIENWQDGSHLQRIEGEVRKICKEHPLYPQLGRHGI